MCLMPPPSGTAIQSPPGDGPMDESGMAASTAQQSASIQSPPQRRNDFLGGQRVLNVVAGTQTHCLDDRFERCLPDQPYNRHVRVGQSRTVRNGFQFRQVQVDKQYFGMLREQIECLLGIACQCRLSAFLIECPMAINCSASASWEITIAPWVPCGCLCRNIP